MSVISMFFVFFSVQLRTAERAGGPSELHRHRGDVGAAQGRL